MLKPTKEERKNMIAVVRNGCCEIRGGAGKPRVTLSPMNIDEAILHRDHVAVVLRNGYCQLYNLKTVESTLSQIRRRRARGTSGLWPSSP